MGERDWFRNERWDAEIEAAFRQKLRRARDKTQYLRIQATCLVRNDPPVALRLLDEYFALGGGFDAAMAHVQRAEAFHVLGDTEREIAAYEAAIQREVEFPNVGTDASIALPFRVAEMRLEHHYDRALDLLAAPERGLALPINSFRRNAAKALIQFERGALDDARRAAELALSEAGVSHSGLRYHPRVGLVGEVDDAIISRLRKVVDRVN